METTTTEEANTLSTTTTSENKNKNSFQRDHVKHSIIQFSIGACAGIASKTGVAPLERLKTIYQVNCCNNTSVVDTTLLKRTFGHMNNNINPSLWTGLVHMYRTEGTRGLFRGNLANCIKTAPTAAFKFFCYEKMKRFFAKEDAQLTNLQVFWSGAVSGIAAHALFYPLDVIKTRLSATTAGTYRTMSDVVIHIIRNEKSIVPFFRGMTASIASTIPQSGIQLTVYEWIKHILVPANTPASSMISIIGLSVAGGSGALVSQIVTYPLKTAKSRMIMQGHGNTPMYNGLGDVFVKTVRSEGITGFFKGFTPNLVKTVPSHCIAFTVYESLRKVFLLTNEK